MKPLGHEKLSQARDALLKNADGLLADAELLADNGRFPRAYALAVLACEELAKLPMLNAASTQLLIGREVDWKRLGERLTQHSRKLGLIDLFNALLAPEDVADEELKRIMSTEWHKSAAVKEMHKGKLDGLYVSMETGLISTPWESLLEPRVRRFLKTARIIYSVFDAAETPVRRMLDEIRDDPAAHRLFIERLHLLHSLPRKSN